MYTQDEIFLTSSNMIDSAELHQLDLPAAAVEALTVFDAALDGYINATTARENAEAELSAAMAADKDALIAALEAGKGDPGTKNTDKADRAAYVAQEGLRLARAKADKAADALIAVCKPVHDEILRTAAEYEISELQAVIVELDAASEALGRANKRRHAGGTFYTAALDATSQRGSNGHMGHFPVEVIMNIPNITDTVNHARQYITLYQSFADHHAGKEPIANGGSFEDVPA